MLANNYFIKEEQSGVDLIKSEKVKNCGQETQKNENKNYVIETKKSKKKKVFNSPNIFM